MNTYSVQTIVKGTRKTYVLRVSDEPLPTYYSIRRQLDDDVREYKRMGFTEDPDTKTLIGL